MTETEPLPKGVAVCRRRVGRWKPIVTEDFSAQGPRGIRLFGEPPLAELGHDVLDELGVAAGDRGVDDIDTVSPLSFDTRYVAGYTTL